jgi:starch synthase
MLAPERSSSAELDSKSEREAKVLPLCRPNRKILFVTPEIDDFVSVGGLGAVSAALPRVLAKWCDVRVLVPGYPQVLAACENMIVVGALPAFASLPACEIGRTETYDGLVIYILLCPELYEREGTPYGDKFNIDWTDNDLRFARLGLAAAELATGTVDQTWSADLLHVNDWPAAFAPAYLAFRGVSLPSILTIHNLAYQGLFPRAALKRIGAPESAFNVEGLEFYDQLSFLKAGIYYASHVTTVSETYAKEITRPEFGCGLDGLLRTRASQFRLTGIINGIDESWEPQTCPQLASRFAPGDWKGKETNTRSVRRTFGLAVTRGPLFGLVSRLVHQKGIDLVMSAAETIAAAGGQLVVIGTGEPRLEASLIELASRYPQAIGAQIGFDDGIARRIFAGSDFMLMPSRYEPCGLSQMYAQRFGSLPIAHRTGGLAETIDHGRTGFLFDDPSPASFLGGICKAFETFAAKRRLNRMRLAAMHRTFSWEHPAQAYDSLYSRMIGNKRARRFRPASLGIDAPDLAEAVV